MQKYTRNQREAEIMIIWLVSYPRSGNTLTRSVFNHYFGLGSLSIHGDLTDIGSNPELGALVGHIEGNHRTIDLDKLRADEKPHLIKTHDLPNEMMQDNDTYIHIVRDGRDSALSYLRYLRRIARHTDVTLSDVVSGRVMFGTWGQHCVRWGQSNPTTYRRFRFEDIITDIPGFAQQLSEVLGIPANTEPFPDIAKFQKAGPGFIGAGKAGNWQTEFSEHEVALFDFHNNCAMRYMGYDSPEPSTDELNAFLAAGSDLVDVRERAESSRKAVQGLKQEVARSREELKHLNAQNSDRVSLFDMSESENSEIRRELADALLKAADFSAQVAELKKKVDYLEPKARKRNKRINRIKSPLGIRPHKLPWE